MSQSPERSAFKHPFGDNAYRSINALHPLYTFFQTRMHDLLCQFCDQRGHEAKECPVKKKLDSISHQIRSTREEYGKIKFEPISTAIKKKRKHKEEQKSAAQREKANQIEKALLDR